MKIKFILIRPLGFEARRAGETHAFTKARERETPEGQQGGPQSEETVSKKGLDLGGANGLNVRAAIQGVVISMPKEERPNFYTGFFSALAGSCAADIGSPAAIKVVEELLEFMKTTPKQTLDEVATDRAAANQPGR